MVHNRPFVELYKLVKTEVKDFGKKPVNDVAQILAALQKVDVSEAQIAEVVQEIYIKIFQESGRGDLNQARQSWVVASGINFEGFIRDLINDSLNKEDILAIKGDQLRGISKTADIVEFLMLKANRRCTQKITGVWPDSDIVVLAKDKRKKLKVFALLNCKTSDHSRNDAVFFWALALRDNNIKYCLVTQDLDKKFVKGDEGASGLRKKAEAYLDRVYTTHPLTTECSQVRKLDLGKSGGMDALFEDLRRWCKEVVPDYSNKLLNREILN